MSRIHTVVIVVVSVLPSASACCVLMTFAEESGASEGPVLPRFGTHVATLSAFRSNSAGDA